MHLFRHRLVRLSEGGWQRALAARSDTQARHCIAHWRAHDLSVVVATQAAAVDNRFVSLGLPAPNRWGRVRIALRAVHSELRLGHDAFPLLAECAPVIAASSRARFSSLCDEVSLLAPAARVYGGFGWQRLTALRYVRPESDLDLLLPCRDAPHADAIVGALLRLDNGCPCLDGELCFEHGLAVAWREWASWRAGRVRAVLAKTLLGARLITDPRLFNAAPEELPA
jgi:phosphoribosyl-dephospho-CoA transferase